MNTERLLHLASVIETKEHLTLDEYEANFPNIATENCFTLEVVRYDNCGSPACIAGWAIHEFSPNYKRTSWTLSMYDAAALLDLPINVANQLFNPLDIVGRWCEITPKDAALALRRLAAGWDVSKIYDKE